MEARAQYRGTLEFGIRPTTEMEREAKYRTGVKIPCPRCGEPMFKSARTCWDCAMELRGEANVVARFMEPVVGLAAQLARFREKVAQDRAWMEEMRERYERGNDD